MYNANILGPVAGWHPSQSRPGVSASSPVKICFIGDLMLGGSISRQVNQRPATDFWRDTAPILTNSDAVVANLESAITTHPTRWSECWKAHHFAADPKVVDILKAGNVRAVNLANNHILDYEARGLEDTIRHLDAAQIAHAGAGMDLAAAWQPTLFRAGPLTVGLIGVTSRMKEFAASEHFPGTAFLSIGTECATLALIGRLVQDLRGMGAATVILSVHWGPDMKSWPSWRFRQFARATIRAGVDVFHGHSAHVIQGVESYDGGFILYDTGGFLDDYSHYPVLRVDHSFAFVVEYQGCLPVKLNLTPVVVRDRQASLAKGDEFQRIVRKMTRRSARLGTELHETTTGLSLLASQRSARGHPFEVKAFCLSAN
jgi:poly-gamma-glutamate capsule biosynthesis protein CapA/YwtB (metallophosphatase superfamily)